MTTGLMSSAISGMQAAQIALQTAGHNISNQNTPGFNRQRIVQASNIAMQTGSGFIGQGTHVSTVERMYSGFLYDQVNSAQSSTSELESYYAQIAQIDNMLADANSGLSPALQTFFTGVNKVAATPNQTAARQTMISSAQTLVARFQALDERVSQLYENVNQQITSQVASINSYSQQIAELNQTIIIAQSSTRQPANDLLDQRDQLVAELNKLVSVTTTTNSDGTFNVFFGSGQQLVVGPQVMTLVATPSSADPSRFTVGLTNGVGIQEMPESLITGGSLSGLLRFRSESLDQTNNELGRNAASLALTFNAQNALGQDQLGQSAGDAQFVSDFFTLSASKVVANTRNSAVNPANVTAALVPPSINGYYTLSLNGAGTDYTLTRQSDGTSWTGTNLALLQAAIPSSEGVALSGVLAAGASKQVTGTGGQYTLALDAAGANYTVTRQSDGTVWTATTLDLLQAAVPAAEGLTLNGVPVPVLAAGTSTQVTSPAAIGANFYTKLTSSDYRFAYDGASYSVLRLSDGQSWSNADLDALSETIANSEGFTISLASGTIAAGDSFVIKPVGDAAQNLAVNKSLAADVRLIAAAMPVMASAASGNSGTGKISNGSSTFGYGTPAIAGTVSLAFNGTTNELTLTGVPAGANVSVTTASGTTVYPGPTIPYTSGATISFAGVSFDISGNLNNSDSFSLAANTAGVSDARNAAALVKLQTQNTMAGSTATYQTAYAQLVSFIGNTTRQIAVTADAQSALLTQSQDARDALSGVNLDEEAANLIRFQQAYQASAKSLQIGASLFDTLLGIMS